MLTRTARRDFRLWLQDVIHACPEYFKLTQLMVDHGYIADGDTLKESLKVYQLHPSHHPLRKGLVARILQSYPRSQSLLWIAWQATQIPLTHADDLITFWCTSLLQLSNPLTHFWPRLGRGVLITVDVEEIPEWLPPHATVLSFEDQVRIWTAPINAWQDHWKPTQVDYDRCRSKFRDLVEHEVRWLSDGDVLVVCGSVLPRQAKVGAWLHVGSECTASPWDQVSWSSFCTAPLAVVQTEKEFQGVYSWMSVCYLRTPMIPRLSMHEIRGRSQQCTGKWLSRAMQHFEEWLSTEEDVRLVSECVRPLGVDLHVEALNVHDHPWWVITLRRVDHPTPTTGALEWLDADGSVWVCPRGSPKKLTSLWTGAPSNYKMKQRIVVHIRADDPLFPVMDAMAAKRQKHLHQYGAWFVCAHSATESFGYAPIDSYAVERFGDIEQHADATSRFTSVYLDDHLLLGHRLLGCTPWCAGPWVPRS